MGGAERPWRRAEAEARSPGAAGEASDAQRFFALGVNVDPRMGTDPAEVAAAGAGWVRSVLFAEPDLSGWLQCCDNAGLRVLAVVARESLYRPSEPIPMAFEEAAALYAARYAGLMHAWQPGNEPDIDSPASWTMAPAELNELLRAFRSALPDGHIVGPGLASGAASYLEGIDLDLVDAIAVHPYGQRPDPEWPRANWGFSYVRDLLGAYRAYGKPIWVTEFGGPLGDFAGARERGEYYGRMAARLAAEPDVRVAFAFCWSDAMVPGFGLLDANGPTPALISFRQAAERLVLSPPAAIHSQNDKVQDRFWRRGLPMSIEERAEQLGPEKLGDRLTDVITLRRPVRGRGAVKIAGYYNGVLLDIDGETWALSEATVVDKFRPAPAP